jgi:hypothetical protein
MKLLFFLTVILLSNSLYSQSITKSLSKSEQSQIINAIKNAKPNDFPITNNTKIIRILSGYIRCDKRSIPSFQLSYLDSLMIDDTSLYWIYNYNDSVGYKVICQFSNEFGVMPYTTGTETAMLNSISKYYDLNKIFIVSILGVGNCIIDDRNIWLINGNAQTDISTYLREIYKFQDFSDRVLQRKVASTEDFSFIPFH